MVLVVTLTTSPCSWVLRSYMPPLSAPVIHSNTEPDRSPPASDIKDLFPMLVFLIGKYTPKVKILRVKYCLVLPIKFLTEGYIFLYPIFFYMKDPQL